MFKRIPGFPKYEISKEGVLRTIKDKVIIPYHRSNGYQFYSLRDEFNNKTSVGRHRALALAYIPLPSSIEPLEVNHIDGSRDVNVLSNLEWVTRSENLKHAYRLGRYDSIQTKIEKLDTGEIEYLYTLNDLQLFLGLNRAKLLKIKGNKNTFNYNGFRITFLIEDYLVRRENPFPKGVCARDIITNKIYFSLTVHELSKEIGVCNKVLKRALINGKTKYPINGYDVRVNSEVIDFPKYKEEEILAFSNEKFIYTPVYVQSKTTPRKLFGSILKASEFTKTHERQIRESLKTGKLCSNGFGYTRHNFSES